MPEYQDEHRNRQAKGCKVGEGDRGHEVQGRDQRAKQQRQHHADGQKDQGQHHQGVLVCRGAGVIGLRRVPADQHAFEGQTLGRAGPAGEGTQIGHHVESLSGERVRLQDDVDAAGAPIGGHEPPDERLRQHRGRGPFHAEGSGGTGGVGHGRVPGDLQREGVQLPEGDRIERPGARGQRHVESSGGEFSCRKAASQQLEAANRLGIVGQAFKLVVVGPVRDQACHQNTESQHRDRKGYAGTTQHHRAHPAVNAASPVGLLHGFGVQARLPGPEGAPSKDGQHRRDQG